MYVYVRERAVQN